MKKIELLSPAGDLERLKVTLLYGADAVYIGGQEYSLRANATNFSLKEIKEACTFAHNLKKKVFLTMNIVFHDEDMDGVEEYIHSVVECGIDAFIVSDPFLIEKIKEKYPQVEVHLSTQHSTMNVKTAEYFKEQGVDRIVLARELSMMDIKEIIDKTGLDIEVFVHGAMCTCLSGRCTLSNYITNRDANRGGCSQVCRFAFSTEDDEEFTMASKDLNLAEHVKDMIDIGITSLKVEGRMRSLYYLATVIGSYRKLIDHIYENTITKEITEKQKEILGRVANRETSTQFFLTDADIDDQYFTGRMEISNQDYLGLITGYDEELKCLILREKNYFEQGDVVEIFTPNGDVYPHTINEIYDSNLELTDVARHPEEELRIPFDYKLEPYSMIRLIHKNRK